MSCRRRRLILTWAVFAGLLAVILATEFDIGGGDGATAPDMRGDGHRHGAGERRMFTFGEAEVEGVDVLYRGRAASLMRNSEGRWFQHDAVHHHSIGATAPRPGERHRATAEAEARIAKQVAITTAMKADRRILPKQGLADYGLEKPAMVVLFHGREVNKIGYRAPLAVLYVGDPDPTEYAYYARCEGDEEISLIPRFQISLLVTLTHGAGAAPTLEPKAVPAPAPDKSLR